MIPLATHYLYIPPTSFSPLANHLPLQTHDRYLTPHHFLPNSRVPARLQPNHTPTKKKNKKTSQIGPKESIHHKELHTELSSLTIRSLGPTLT